MAYLHLAGEQAFSDKGALKTIKRDTNWKRDRPAWA